jgi:ApbE superfamily uncharacterized protein (UPF0280 family)
MTALAAMLPDGRLHLQHGPIDCLCRAWGEPDQIARAYAQASDIFPEILPTLCAELPALRTPLPSLPPAGEVARAMHAACAPFADRFITPMAAVAGAVADHVLAAMLRGTRLARAFVNDGGDIAFHLSHGETLRCGMVADLAVPALDAVVTLTAEQPARGIATSGRACKGHGGRSFSFGIADAVTVLAATAARADAAATIIANAVDLPGHPAIVRRPAIDIDPDSDLGARAVTWDVFALSASDIDTALDAGCAEAEGLRRAGLIAGAALSLGGRMRLALAPSLAGTLS